jgi:hypothetical protein
MSGLYLSVGLCSFLFLGLGLCLRTRALLLRLSSDYPAPDEAMEEGEERQGLVIGGLVLPRGFRLSPMAKGLLITPGPWFSRLGTAPISVPWEGMVVENRGRKSCTLLLGQLWISVPASALHRPEAESSGD